MSAGVPGEPASGAVGYARKVARSAAFQNAILVVIVANAILVGLETSSGLDARFGQLFDTLSVLVQAIFTIEIAIRLIAYLPHPERFFRDGWNTFDFVVVAFAFVPATGGLSNLARLARILRATRLISALPGLRLIIETLLRSIPSFAHIIVLLGLFMYVYAVVGSSLYGRTDPEYWGSLGSGILTLFKVLTLEGWPDIHNRVMEAHPWSWVFFSTFIIVAVLIIANLAVAVIISSLEAAKREEAERFDVEVPGEPLAHIEDIRTMLDRLETDIRSVAEEIRLQNRDPSR